MQCIAFCYEFRATTSSTSCKKIDHLSLAKESKFVDWSTLCRRSIIPSEGFIDYIRQMEVVVRPVVPRLQQLVDEM
jgi:hypothetical protein